MPATIWLECEEYTMTGNGSYMNMKKLVLKTRETPFDKLISGGFKPLGKHCAARVVHSSECCKGWPWLPLLQTCAVQSVVQTSVELGGTVYVASGVMVYILCTTAAFSKQQQQPSAPKFSCENSVWYIYYYIVRKFVKWKHWLANHVSWRVFHARSAMNAVNQKSLASSRTMTSTFYSDQDNKNKQTFNEKN